MILESRVQERRVIANRVLGIVGALVAGVLGPPAHAGRISLFDGRGVATVVHDSADASPLAEAARLLAGDLAALTGRTPAVLAAGAAPTGSTIVIGRVDSPVMARLLKENRVDTTPLDHKWETYGRAVVRSPWNPRERILLIFGSDTRGTIWGVTDLSRALGVSPWEWWADVTPRRVRQLTVDDSTFYSNQPSVRFRGIFVNDEDFGIWPWAKSTFEPEVGDMGPKTYERIFQLMWRLKANVIWPAMHPDTGAFNAIPGNVEMADRYAIVHGTSHAEPMLRNPDREWDVTQQGPFNWMTNRQAILDDWDRTLNRLGGYENMYTVGLRGIGDRMMQGVSTAEQNRDVLAGVIAEQRRLLQAHLGKPAAQVPQVLTPYKEVLAAYRAGLKVPDDVTLVWPDDNHGYLRGLSDPDERKRSGGSGLYYHISAEAFGQSFLWLATLHPALMWSELDKGYAFDADRVWILNVGDIKPGEYLTQLFLDMAYDRAAFPDVASVKDHLRRWAAENLGAAHASEAADILWRYYDLAFSRMPELMGFDRALPGTVTQASSYSIIANGDENARRVAAYRDIAARAAALAKRMPADRRDAFFELVQFPVESSAQINARVLDYDRSIEYGRQRRASANIYAERAAAQEKALDAGEHRYNAEVASGKWKLMMDRRAGGRALFAAPSIPRWDVEGGPVCGLQAEGGAFIHDTTTTAAPYVIWPVRWTFHRQVPRSRYIDVFAGKPSNVHWTANASAPWIRLSELAGQFDPAAGRLEKRIDVSIDWATAPPNGHGSVDVGCDGQPARLRLDITIAPEFDTHEVSFIEVDHVVSIYAHNADTTSIGWSVVDGLGHTGASLRSAYTLSSLPLDPSAEAIAGAPMATYRFATTTADDTATLRLIALPMLPVTAKNGMRVAVSVDDGPPRVLDLDTVEMSETWQRNALSNTAIAEVPGMALTPGPHVLKVYALDPGIVLDRIEIAFAAAPRVHDPIPETRISPRR